jgi:rfaE bifunctional protein kinase chain/domain/rfaE bifunctional protein nucleotidyltransferase chain/domain
MSNGVNNTRDKIKSIEELAGILECARSEGKKVVHCHGVFDLLHIGHIRHLEEAKKQGDVLVVTLTPDKYVNKGPGRPVFREDLRAEAIAALDCPDYVAINRWPMAVETIRLLRPDFFVKGSEYDDAQKDRTGGIALEEAAVKSVGGQIAFTDDITFSSSNLINRHMAVFPKEVSEYLASVSSRYSSADILRYLESARPLKVLVVGETIIDEYLYCETLGKTGKDPVLAARHLGTERFAGGIVAVANHVSAFCDKVSMLTFLGQTDTQEDLIQEKLDPKVDQMFLYMGDGAPTIVKRRLVEAYPFQKLFELYVMDDDEYKPTETRALCSKLEEVLPNYDVVIVTDYGHGMLGPEAVELLCDRARFLAVNTQVNAGNRGFNTVSKYRRADYICVSEHEIRLEARSRRRRDLRDIVQEIGTKLSCERIVVTRGQQGCVCYSKSEGFFEVPAFAVNIVDRIGAGDAVFAVTALCVAQDAPMEIVGLIGNAVGAEAVATVGHRSSIQALPLFRHIESLLK